MNIEKFVNINWYIKRKPYKTHTEYDIFYLKICRKLFIIIYELSQKHTLMKLNQDECRALAYIIISYFEDVVNGIGFWQSVIELNKKHFKKRLPFFTKEELEDEELEFDDIISADIHYLLYAKYVALKNTGDEGEIVFFESSFFHEATDAIFNYLLDIEEVHTTTFYERYLIPDEDYIDFKDKLSWFTLEGYLTGVEFTLRMQDYRFKLEDEYEDDKSMIPRLMYAEADRLLFEAPSALTAYFPLDIFAGALHCSETEKEEIRSLKFRPTGIFHVEKESGKHILFKHTATCEEFNVLKRSFTKAPDVLKEEYWMATFVKWGSDYYISGLGFPFESIEEEIYKINMEKQQNFQRHFSAYREQVTKTALDFRNETVRFFGKELIEFTSGEEMQNKINDFNDWYFENISNKSNLKPETEAIKIKLPKEILKSTDVALFIPPCDNYEMIQGHKKLLEVLQTTLAKITRDDANDVANLLLANNVSKEYWYYLKQHYSLPNLSFILRCNVEPEEDFEAMLRIYKPHEFSPLKLPRFKTFYHRKSYA